MASQADGCGEWHVEPTGASRPVEQAHHLLFVGHSFLIAHVLLNPFPVQGAVLWQQPFRGGTHLPVHSLPACAPPTLQWNGATSQTAALAGLPARHQQVPCSPACATARTGRKQEPCSSLPAVHSASNPASLAWLKYS